MRLTGIPRLRLPLAIAAAAALTACSGSATPHDAHARPAPPTYYLALGDSLSQGVQPDAAGASVETRYGYPDQVYAALHPSHPALELVKLGCPGETTSTMINGGICPYPGGSQLKAAVAFLHAHRDRVLLVTIDIGANDPEHCAGQEGAGQEGAGQEGAGQEGAASRGAASRGAASRGAASRASASSPRAR